MSDQILKFISHMKNLQVRKEGKEPSSVHALTIQEFEEMISIIRNFDSIINKYSVSSYFIFQYNLMACVDDVAHVQIENLVSHPQFVYALGIKVHWSKNVLEERQVPLQILLRSKTPTTCVLLALSIHLETWLVGDVMNYKFLFVLRGKPDLTKNWVSKIMKKNILDSSSFIYEGKLGTHSVRKAEATYCGLSGCTRYDIGIHGHWKFSVSKIVDTYVDTKFPYPDAKVDATLCLDGPCKYCLRENSGISEQWILDNVVPSIYRSGMSKKFATILSLPYLWACLESNFESYLPKKDLNRVKLAYENICQIDVDLNPVQKVGLLINQINGCLTIDEYIHFDDRTGIESNSVSSISSTQVDHTKISGMYSKIQQFVTSHDDMKSDIKGKMNSMIKSMSVMQKQ